MKWKRLALAAVTMSACAAAICMPSLGCTQHKAPSGDREPPRLVAATAPADSQPAPVAADPPTANRPVITKLYSVSDLTIGVFESPYDWSVIPATLIRTAGASHGFGPESSLFTSVGDDNPKHHPVGMIEIDKLVELIREETGKDEWNSPAAIYSFDDVLVVRHHLEMQKQVGDILEQLRATRTFGRGVQVTAHWVLVKPDALANLLTPGTNDVDPKALAALPEASLYARSSIRMITGPTTTLLAGRAHTAITGQEPSVGAAVAAYSPQVSQVLAGAFVQNRRHHQRLNGHGSPDGGRGRLAPAWNAFAIANPARAVPDDDSHGRGWR